MAFTGCAVPFGVQRYEEKTVLRVLAAVFSAADRKIRPAESPHVENNAYLCKMKKTFASLLTAAALVPWLLVSCFPHAESPAFDNGDTAQPAADTAGLVEKPAADTIAHSSVAIEIPAIDSGETIICYSGFALSYNRTTLVPDWVAYELTAAETEGGYTTKSSSFSRDPNLKGRQASREDYSRSGWDKGHMAPKADMRWSEKSYWESHYFTNVCPQNHRLNCGDWNRLEKAVRSWAQSRGSVWVVCGPIFTTNAYGTIGASEVHIPDYFFKALLTRCDGRYSAIGFVFPNDDRDYQLRKQAVTIDRIEELIGRDLFPALPDDEEVRAEAAFHWDDWPL